LDDGRLRVKTQAREAAEQLGQRFQSAHTREGHDGTP
jgi:hypothetical protein